MSKFILSLIAIAGLTLFNQLALAQQYPQTAPGGAEIGVKTKPMTPAEVVERTKSRVTNIFERLTETLNRIENALPRAQRLMTNFAGRGFNVAAAKAAETEAVKAIADARAKIAKLPAFINNLSPASLTPNLRSRGLAEVREALEAVKGAHARVVDIIVALRADVGAAGPTPLPAPTPIPATD